MERARCCWLDADAESNTTISLHVSSLFFSNPTHTKALFRSNFFLDFDTVALSFLFDKYYLILEQLGLKDSSRDLQVNCTISYLFYLYLMFHAYAARFDVMGNLVKF